MITKYYISIKIQINYPSSKQIPILTEKRIFTLSSNENTFNGSKEIYQKALEKSGCRRQTKCQQQQTK